MQKYFFLIILTFLCMSFEYNTGNEINLHYGGLLHHFDNRQGPQEYNENPNLIGIEYNMQFDHKPVWYGLRYAYYNNSIDNDSHLIGGSIEYRKQLDLDDNWKTGVGIGAGVVTGYRYAVSPMALPYAFLRYKRLETELACNFIKLKGADLARFCIANVNWRLFEW